MVSMLRPFAVPVDFRQRAAFAAWPDRQRQFAGHAIGAGFHRQPCEGRPRRRCLAVTLDRRAQIGARLIEIGLASASPVPGDRGLLWLSRPCAEVLQ
jgi:hypothetical protein